MPMPWPLCKASFLFVCLFAFGQLLMRVNGGCGPEDVNSSRAPEIFRNIYLFLFFCFGCCWKWESYAVALSYYKIYSYSFQCEKVENLWNVVCEKVILKLWPMTLLRKIKSIHHSPYLIKKQKFAEIYFNCSPTWHDWLVHISRATQKQTKNNKQNHEYDRFMNHLVIFCPKSFWLFIYSRHVSSPNEESIITGHSRPIPPFRHPPLQLHRRCWPDVLYCVRTQHTIPCPSICSRALIWLGIHV